MESTTYSISCVHYNIYNRWLDGVFLSSFRFNNMKLKRLILLTFTVLSSSIISAQTINELWLSMPQNMTPYLTEKQKKEVIDNYKSDSGLKVTNNLQGTTYADTLSADYGHFCMSDSKDLYLILLPTKDNDSIMLCIETYKTPDAQSKLEFYNRKWQKLSKQDKIPNIEMENLISRPDTMSIETYDNLRSLISPELISFQYNVSSKTLEANLATPLLSADERNKLKNIFSKYMLKWDGVRFN